MRDRFDSEYIVFEFKNHSDIVKQNQVVTTNKYLSTISFRKVAIIISRKGYHDNAIEYAESKRVAQNHLLLLLSDEDLQEMIIMKLEGGDPSILLERKIDRILNRSII